MRLKELQEKKGKLAAEIRALSDAAAGRGFTPEEQTKWERINAEYDGAAAELTRELRADQVAREAAEAAPPVSRQDTRAGADPGPAGGETTFRHELPLASKVFGRKVERELSFGSRERELHAGVPNGPRSQPEYRSAFRHALSVTSKLERRDMQADVFNVGGALVPPLEFIARLIQDVDDLVFVRQFATVLALTSAAAIGAPSLDTDVADTDWTTELATGGEDTALRVGRRELSPKPLAKLKKISKKLIRASAISADALVRQRLAYKQAITQEKAFLSGTGAGQPLGVFTASADGISTGRDMSTGNSTTDIGADGLVEALGSLKAEHQRNAIWGFHRNGITRIRKLKTGDGQYLWVPGLSSPNATDQILGRPYFMSEYVPNTFTTGLYVGIVGDFSFYWIAEALGMTIEVLSELYAATNENGYILRSELDGMPVLETAFARVKLA